MPSSYIRLFIIYFSFRRFNLPYRTLDVLSANKTAARILATQAAAS